MNDSLVTVKVLSKLLLISERRIQQLVKENILAKEGNGKYPLIRNINAYINYINLRSNNKPSCSDDDNLNEAYKKEKVRLTKAQADNEEIKARLASKQSIDAEQINIGLSAVFNLIRNNLLSVPERVEPILVGETDKELFNRILTNEISDAMFEVCKGIEETMQKVLGSHEFN